MPPNFFSKLVKNPSHTRDRSDRSIDADSGGRRSRALSAVSTSSDRPRPSTGSATGNGLAAGGGRSRVASINTGLANAHSDAASTTSSQPNVTIVPPSPSVHSSTAASTDGRHSTVEGTGFPSEFGGAGRERKVSTSSRVSRMSPVDEDRTPTVDRTPMPTLNSYGFSLPGMKSRSRPPTPTSRPNSRPGTPSSTKGRSRAGSDVGDVPPVPATNGNGNGSTLMGSLRSKASSKSLNKLKKLDTSKEALGVSADKRAMTSPGPDATVESPELVESPTSLEAPAGPEESTATGTQPPTSTHPEIPTSSPSPPPPSSPSSSPNVDRQQQQQNQDKFRWGRSNRKPTGLASAIAASGLVMVNPALAPQHTLLSNGNGAPRKSSVAGNTSPYMNGDSSTPNSGSSVHMRAATTNDVSVSPRSKASLVTGGRRRTSLTASRNSAPSEYGDKEAQVDYYSGLDDDDSLGDSDSDEAESGVSGSRLGDESIPDDIPVTGFAVASSKRNADFHELFPAVPEGDYLIEDYGCALQREILIQGRLYISENHICFHANIFGWITDLIVPICEIVSLEKKMTAFVIPNALQISTRQSKYTFASFLARDTTYDVIYNIWRLVKPTDAVEGDGQDTSRLVEGVVGEQTGETVAVIPGVAARKATQCKCGSDATHPPHYDQVAMDIVLPGTPEKIYNLMFASAFIKEFMAVDQKLMDIQVSDWTPVEPGSKLLTRNMSYIKPLNGSVGPKQTKCELRDELVHCDYEESVTTVTTTRTPDVPSGGVFSVKTLTCITWASAVSVRVLVTTQVEWTGRSFIKGIIEKSCIDGQKTYHADLDKAMRAYIQEHQSEFVPAGVDAAAVAAAVTTVPLAPDGVADTRTSAEKQREQERNQRSLQWAWDTFDGAWHVASSSTKGAIALIRDSWEQSSSTTVLYFIIVMLVLSNVWTLMRMGSREEVGRRKEMKKMEERERWVQGVVGALWDEMASTRAGLGAPPVILPRAGKPRSPDEPVSVEDEVSALHRTLDEVESRVRAIRGQLDSLGVNTLD
ncbi:hypothetical protein EV714DRAFT_271504 [Schizophyllum commune]